MRESFGVADAEESLGIKPLVLQRPQIPETCEPHLVERMKQCWQDDPKVDQAPIHFTLTILVYSTHRPCFGSKMCPITYS